MSLREHRYNVRCFCGACISHSQYFSYIQYILYPLAFSTSRETSFRVPSKGHMKGINRHMQPQQMRQAGAGKWGYVQWRWAARATEGHWTRWVTEGLDGWSKSFPKLMEKAVTMEGAEGGGVGIQMTSGHKSTYRPVWSDWSDCLGGVHNWCAAMVETSPYDKQQTHPT